MGLDESYDANLSYLAIGQGHTYFWAAVTGARVSVPEPQRKGGRGTKLVLVSRATRG